jgi:hypothetical protein
MAHSSQLGACHEPVKKTVVKIGPFAYHLALDRHSGLSKTEYGAGQGSLHVCLKNGKT